MKILALIQARMGSSRLPGKVLAPILGKPMLAWQLERLSHSRHITQTVVATSVLVADDAIAEFCAENHYPCFRGSEENVLSRFYEATLNHLTEAQRDDALVLRLTGDCPLVDPQSIDEGITQFQQHLASGCRYYGYESDLPDGMDFEVFTWKALKEVYDVATDSFEKEHVTPFMWRNPARFGIIKYHRAGIMPGLRFSVDYAEDLELVQEIFKRELKAGRRFGMKEISDLLTSDETLRELNSKIVKNEGLLITSLRSETYKIEVAGRKLSKYGVVLADPAAPADEFFEWAERVGIDAWLTSPAGEDVLKRRVKPTAQIWNANTLPPGWVAFDAAKFEVSDASESAAIPVRAGEAHRTNWKDELYALARNPQVHGILLGTTERGKLAELLMFLCQERFAYAYSAEMT